MSTDGCHVAIDVGGTKIRSARVSADGGLIDEVTAPTPADDGALLLRTVAEHVRRLAGHDPIGRVGVALPGAIERSSGQLLRSQNLPGLATIDVPRSLADHLDAPVAIDNDVALAAVGERWQGAARGVDEVAVIAVGTGIGSGLLTGGHLLRGARGLAGELADLPVLGDPFDPAQRDQGPLEYALGTVGLLRRYRELGGRGDLASVRAVFDASAHETAAAQVIAELHRGLALTVMALRAIVDPELVVLTGGIGAAPGVAEGVGDLLDRLCGPQLRVVRSQLGDRAGLVGAAAVAQQREDAWAVGVPTRA